MSWATTTYKQEGREASALRGKVGNGSYTREQVMGKAEPGNEEAVANAGEGPRYHKVKRGETLSSIARMRGTTVENICRLNHIGKSKRVKAGQILRFS